MNGFIALYLIACLDPTNHNTCVSLPVVDSTEAQPDGSEMTMMGCIGCRRNELGEEVLGGAPGHSHGLSLRRLVLPNR
jgi:hypothetical protein